MNNRSKSLLVGYTVVHGGAMLPLLLSLAMANDLAVTSVDIQNTGQGAPNDCNNIVHPISTTATFSITNSVAYLDELRDIRLDLEGFHGTCDMILDRARIIYNGEVLWEEELSILSQDRPGQAWHINETLWLDDLPRVVSDGEATIVQLVVEGRGSYSSARVRGRLRANLVYGRDWDGDGYPSEVLFDCDSVCPPDLEEADGGCLCDCDDDDPNVYPGATEIPGDGIDQSCSDTELCYENRDGDDYRTDELRESQPGDIACEGDELALAAVLSGDCNDDDPTVYPDADEIPYDRIDQSCNEQDLLDRDGDNFAGIERAAWEALPDPDGLSWPGHLDPREDCDDDDPNVYPGATEIPGDGIDQSCSGTELCFVNKDGDPFRIDETLESAEGDIGCDAPGLALAVIPPGDCDDNDPNVYPGAPEIPGDGIDQSCSGTELCFVNKDGDPFRIDETLESAEGDIVCGAPGLALAVVPPGDCDDTNPNIYPGATEIPGDGVDQSCSGTELCFQNRDGDGFRTALTTESAPGDLTCAADGLALASLPSDDCDDEDPTVYPGAEEIVADGIDQSCTNTELCYQDRDLDGWRTEVIQESEPGDIRCEDLGLALAIVPTLDCDDDDPTIHPGATETPGDGIDQNCSGTELCFEDLDQDGWRTGNVQESRPGDLGCTEASLTLLTVPDGDCDDSDPLIHPGAEEIWYDGIDQDCDGWSDFDPDRDGRIWPDYAERDADFFASHELSPTTISTDDCYDEYDSPLIADEGPLDPQDIPRTRDWYNGVDDDCSALQVVIANGEIVEGALVNDFDQDGDGFLKREITLETFLAYVERYAESTRAPHHERLDPPPRGDSPMREVFLATFGPDREAWEAWYEAHKGDCNDLDPQNFPGSGTVDDDCNEIPPDRGRRTLPDEELANPLAAGCACDASGQPIGWFSVFGLLAALVLRRKSAART
ncbi:MAG: hypothetical protein EA397_02225 [Deltaproteobacteria bacterium]|nr:MAG: hypothetical protein EA397_02225 [Deltaproteobacteria bacterium]